ncbi:MAG: TatD family hydrolase [Gammaproteobacteria bacterium]
MLVDSHCHIPLLSDSMAVDEILGHARDNDIEHMLCVAIDMEGSPEIIELANRHEMVSASVGVHPNTELTAPIDERVFLEMAADKEVVAVGETGLDYFRSEGDLEWQRDRFRLHIKLAKELDKPLIIHTREAKEDTLRILKEEGADTVGGVMHCFVEDWETAQKAMDLGFYISFSGIVTFKNARELQDVARQVPLEQMLVETDSPYLAPVPYRGKTNQPAFVRHVAEFIAELKQVEFTDVAEKTTANYYRLFN